MDAMNLQPANLQESRTRLDEARMQQLQRGLMGTDAQDEKKLREAAQEFEGIFVQQLLEAMDKTVDRENSLLGGGSAESYFRGMLHEHMAKDIAARPGGSGFGLAESIYRQMSTQLKPAPEAGADAQATGGEG